MSRHILPKNIPWKCACGAVVMVNRATAKCIERCPDCAVKYVKAYKRAQTVLGRKPTKEEVWQIQDREKNGIHVLCGSIKKAKSGIRCSEDAFKCPDFERCLDLADSKGWRGWVTV